MMNVSSPSRTSAWRQAPLVALLLLASGGAIAAEPPHDAFYWLGELNKASAVMVVERGIVPKPLGARIARAVAQVNADGDKPGAVRSGDYLKVEQSLIAVGGPDVTRLHSGRSRQDIGSTRTRLFQREDMLAVAAALDRARDALIEMAASHPNAIVPAYTWGVQAQPTTYGHYLLAYEAALARDAERLRQAWARLNTSPLGAAALGTSSFPIDRPRLATLLGFEGLVENSLDANQISPVDSGAEAVGIASSAALTIGLMLADLTAQYAQPKPWLMITEGELTGTSSIMPQKRNPVVLEHLRARIGWVLGDAHTAATLVHSAALGDTVDVEDEFYEPLFRTFEHGLGVLRLLDAALSTCQFDVELLAERAAGGFTTATELADTLVRRANLSFRQAHRVASKVVELSGADSARVDVALVAEAARQALGREIRLAPADLTAALDPWSFVAQRHIPGGPAPSAMEAHLAQMRDRLATDIVWREQRQAQIEAARVERHRRAATLRS